MAERSLELHFVLEGEERLSPTDFVNFFNYGVDFARDIVESEALDLFEELQLSSEWQIQGADELRTVMKRSPAPGEVREIRHSSPWFYRLAIPASTIVFFVSKCLHPEIKRAWLGSNARSEFFEFMRDRVFGGAVQKVRRRVARKPSRKGVRARAVEELPSQPDTPVLEVRMERTLVLPVSVADEELIEEFRKQLKK